MYTFVFLWTPALSPNGEKVAHGMIFACFMMSCMAGSTIAGRLLSDSKRYSVSHYMKVPLSFTMVIALVLAVPHPMMISSLLHLEHASCTPLGGLLATAKYHKTLGVLARRTVLRGLCCCIAPHYQEW